MRALGLFVAGGALGALIGLLVGLSISPVVASVVSGLLGVVAAYGTARLGGGLAQAVKPEAAAAVDPKPPSVEVHLYLAGFALFAIAAVLLGIYLRTHDSLAPTPKERVARWKEAGFADEEARKLVAQASGAPGTITAATASGHSVLVAAESELCGRLLSALANEQWPLVEREFQRAGGVWTRRWKELALQGEEQRHQGLRAFAEASCAEPRP